MAKKLRKKPTGRKIVKSTKIYYKDSTVGDFIDHINKNYPISLKLTPDIIDNIAENYPSLDKTGIAIVAEALLKSLRTLILSGNIINIANLCSKFKLSYVKTKFGFCPKIRLSLTKKLKKEKVKSE